VGAQLYPRAGQLLICADSGGSNGYRVRLWKVELQQFATETGLTVTVCHFPPGTSKWNKIEHRLFFIVRCEPKVHDPLSQMFVRELLEV